MTPSSKAKVLTDEVLKKMRNAKIFLGEPAATVVGELIDNIDALKDELALKDKVVEAARVVEAEWWFRIRSEGAAKLLFDAINDLDKVMAPKPASVTAAEQEYLDVLYDEDAAIMPGGVP